VLSDGHAWTCGAAEDGALGCGERDEERERARARARERERGKERERERARAREEGRIVKLGEENEKE
jgi:hypothetical protein